MNNNNMTATLTSYTTSYDKETLTKQLEALEKICHNDTGAVCIDGRWFVGTFKKHEFGSIMSGVVDGKQVVVTIFDPLWPTTENVLRNR